MTALPKERSNPLDMILILDADRMGIFQVDENYYSATMKLTDVNYNLTREEEQTEIFISICQALNFLQEETLQINIVNRRVKEEVLRDKMKITLKNDGLDDIRRDLNDYMVNTAIDGSRHTKEIYFTVKTKAKSTDEGKLKLLKTLNSLGALLKGTGTKYEIMSTKERLALIHDLIRNEEKMTIYNSSEELEDIRSLVAPREIAFKKDYIKVENRIHQTLEIASLPRSIRDSFIVDLLDLDIECNISINIKPITIRNAVDMVEKQMLNVETELINSQSKAMQNKRYNWIPPRKLTQQKSNIENIDSMLKERNQKLFEINFSIDHIANSLDNIKKQKEEIQQLCGVHVIDLKPSEMLEESFLSTVPIGNNYNYNSMLFTTESLTALLLPFSNVDFFDKNGTFMGINQTSRKPILVNRSNLMSGGTNCILGVPGSGKSMKTKINIALEFLTNPYTEILLIDPEKEYTKLVDRLGGVNVTISADSKTYKNCCDLAEKEKSLTGLKSKAEFLIMLINTMMEAEGLTTIEKSLLDKAISMAYKPMINHDYDPKYIPTLEDVRQELLNSKEDDAIRIGKSIEIYTLGSLSLFSHKTNIDTNNRLVNYDISSLNDGLKPLAYLNVLESIWQRVCLNRERGINTYIVVDEAHLLFVNSYCENYLQKSIKRWRKYGGYSDIISQNVSEMLGRPKIATLISNSSIITLLNQSPVEKALIEEKLEISPLQLSYVTNNEKGTGIMRIDGSIVPFDIRIPKNLSLYKLITTKFNEKIA